MDKRIEKTLANIDNAFFDLIKEKDIGKITVTDICNAANINRCTFYSHYKDIPDLVETKEAELAQSVFDIFSSYHFDQDTDEIVHLTFDSLKNNRDLCGLLFSPASNGRVMSHIIQVLKEKTIPLWTSNSNLSKCEAEFAFSYMINGMIALIRGIYNNEFDLDEKTMRDLYDNLVKHGIYHYIYRESDCLQS